MKKITRKKAAVKPRKLPQQQRSTSTVEAIVEAAARVLERSGFDGFNTNAVAESAGVSIGSLYQYFSGKQDLLCALIEREMKPLVEAGKQLSEACAFRAALRFYVQASVRNQMRRPELARLIDLAEKRELFHDQVTSTSSHLQHTFEKLLTTPDAPRVPKRELAAVDVITIIRGLVDAAGERAERETPYLIQRIEGAVMGYLSYARFQGEA